MKTTITLFLLCFKFAVYAQSNTVISGGTAIGGTGSATYTVGQIDYQTSTATNGTVSQGVQQAFEIVTLGTNDVPQIQLLAVVYPNPTVQNVTLAIKDHDLTHLEYQLYDMQGRLVSQGKLTQSETQIEMGFLTSATYFLQVAQSGAVLKTFKIIKN